MPETPRARALAKELRAARKSVGMTLRQLGDALGWSEAKVSRVETARTAIKEDAVADLLDVLGVDGEPRGRLLKLARDAEAPAWWELGRDLPQQVPAYIDVEQRAVRITETALSLVPGLLQTRPYTRAVMEAAGIGEDEIDDFVSIRQVRQGVLSRRDPVHLRCFIDEAALLRPIGGHRVMAGQLRALITASAEPNVSLGVLPFATGAHAGLGGTFVLFEFADAPTVTYVEARTSGAFLERPEEVARFLDAAERLEGISLAEEESTAFLQRYAEMHERAAT